MIKRKDKIVIAALELLDEGGVLNITTKNLAERQSITEPALYRQFKNKHAIFVEIVREFSGYDNKIFNTIKEKEMKGLDAIGYYLDRFTELFQNYSELATVICSFDLYFYSEDTKKMMTEVIMNRELFLESWLTQYPIKNSSMTAKLLSQLINDLLYAEVFRWRLQEKNYDLTSAVRNKVFHIIDA